MRLISDSTTLRRLGPEDLRAFQAYRQDPDIARYQSWEAMDDIQATEFLAYMKVTEPLLRPGDWTQIAVADTSTDALLGDMGLHLAAEGTTAELGITLATAAQGRGHATRAVGLAVRLLFDQTDITHINAWSDVRNTASRALMHHAGFSQIGFETNDGVDEIAFALHRP